VLAREPGNVKALLRRGAARHAPLHCLTWTV